MRNAKKTLIPVLILLSIGFWWPGTNGDEGCSCLFRARQDFAVAEGPVAVASADFNQDGFPDLAVAYGAKRYISILLGQKNGTVKSLAKYPVYYPVRSLVAADFNGDGNPDLAVAEGIFSYWLPPYNQPDGTLAVFLGKGNGTFYWPEYYPLFLIGSWPISLPLPTACPCSLTSADFNKDGNLDLAVVSHFQHFCSEELLPPGSLLSVFLGAGDGTFALTFYNVICPEKLVYYEYNRPNFVASSDFNNDGVPDLAVAHTKEKYLPEYDVIFLLGIGDGTFSEPCNHSLPAPPDSIATGDFNSDGNIDLAAVGGKMTWKITWAQELHDPTDNLTILLGAGDGTFQEEENDVAVGISSSVVADDFNGDDMIDLVMTNCRSDTLSFLAGSGDGTFQEAVTFAAGSYPCFVTACDLNSDGNPDLAVANRESDSVSVFLKSEPVFRTADEYKTNHLPSSLICADFNQVGNPDLAAANWDGQSLTVFLADEDGNLGEVGGFSAGLQPISVTAADFDLDGNPDVAAANRGSDKVSVLLGAGAGSFADPIDSAVGSYPYSLATADFNGDCVPDLATANRGSDNVSILLGTGDGTFSGPDSCPVNKKPICIVSADFNLDGSSDLAVLNRGEEEQAGSISVLLGNGDGTFVKLSHYPSEPWSNPVSLTAADVNGDGIPDLTIPDQDSQEIMLLFGAGNGSFPETAAYHAGLDPSFAIAADFNLDGTIDLAVANRTGNNISLLLGTGDSFQHQGLYGTGRFPSFLAGADFNSDGKPDLAAANYGSESITVLLNLFNRPPEAEAGPDQTAEATSGAGAQVSLDASASSDPDSTPGTNNDIVSFRWYEDYGSPGETYLGEGEYADYTFSLGTHAVTLLVIDSAGAEDTDELIIQVVDTTPPEITLSLNPSLLWPPNHKLVEVTASITVSDIADPDPGITLTSITSSEPDNGRGDGNTTNDIQEAEFGTDDRSFSLRAERSGKGNGRIYTVIYTAADASGNSSTAGAVVTVPHNR